jgi:hypothetical protein
MSFDMKQLAPLSLCSLDVQIVVNEDDGTIAS